MKERAYPVYTVNKHAEGLLVGGHPWVYENDILHSPENEPENGTLADVVSTKGSYLGTGFVSLKSKIRVRLISRNANDTFDAAFWRRRVEYAWNYRKTVLEPADLSACRVIFGEADQFPGLTVDRFSNILVTQTLSVGMEKLKPVLFPILAEVLRADGQTIDGIYERNDEALRAKEGLEQNKGWFELPGETHPASTQTEICENGVYYHVDFENGQKTGWSHRAGLLYPHRQLCTERRCGRRCPCDRRRYQRRGHCHGAAQCPAQRSDQYGLFVRGHL